MQRTVSGRAESCRLLLAAFHRGCRRPPLSTAVVLIIVFTLVGCAHPYRRGTSTRERLWFTNRTDGLVLKETWREEEKGGGTFLLTDPVVASITAYHTNQNDLGGGSYISTGQMSITVDPKTGEVISASGTAIGNIIGAALKKAAVP